MARNMYTIHSVTIALLVSGTVYSLVYVQLWLPIIVNACLTMNALRTMPLSICMYF